MKKQTEILTELIAAQVCGKELSVSSDNPFTDDFLFELYNLSKKHGVSHIVGSALINNGLLKGRPAENVFRDETIFTAFRYETQKFVLDKVCRVLEKSAIPHIPLKGAVISELYPEPWMRTGCDIDILVHEHEAEKAAKAIAESLGYKITGKGNHDFQILSAENIYIELHFSLIEENYSPAIAKVLENVWDYAKPAVNGGYRYELDGEMFYYYHVAHMAKHFICGGCGVRAFLDLWLMNENKKYLSDKKTKILLKKGSLADFAQTAEKLSEVWFSGKEHDEVTLIMQEYIISGGIFGSAETKMLSSQNRSGGRIKYLLSRIFVPYDDLKGQYPIIKKYRFLTPLCEICRLFSLLFGKKRKFRKKYIDGMKNTRAAEIDNIKLLFERVGLS